MEFSKMSIWEMSALKIGLTKRPTAERKTVANWAHGEDLGLNLDTRDTTLVHLASDTDRRFFLSYRNLAPRLDDCHLGILPIKSGDLLFWTVEDRPSSADVKLVWGTFPRVHDRHLSLKCLALSICCRLSHHRIRARDVIESPTSSPGFSTKYCLSGTTLSILEDKKSYLRLMQQVVYVTTPFQSKLWDVR
jgi:hypothetical protein